MKTFEQVNNIMWDRMKEETEGNEVKVMRWFFAWIFMIVLWIAWMQGPREYLLELLGIENEK